MRSARLVDERMMRDLASFYPNRLTIRRTTGTRNSVGEVIGTPADVSGLVAIPARIGRDRSVVADETRLPERTAVLDRFSGALAGYYPTIRLTDTAVDEDGIAYNITAVDHDAGRVMTVLRLEVAA